MADYEAFQGKYARIDPLKNKDLFDNEASSDDEMDVDQDVQAPEEKKVKSPESKKKYKEDLFRISQLSNHIDLISELSRSVDKYPWYVLPPISDSTSQSFPDHRSDNCVNNHALETEVLYCSSEQLKKKLGRLDDIMIASERDESRVEVNNSQASLYYSGLVDTFLIDRIGRSEMISGMRGLARIEEHRKAAAASSSRRGSRFTHLFSQNEVNLEEKTLNLLCNALID